MGAHLHLAAISDSNISMLENNPRLIWTVVFPESLEQLKTGKHSPVPRKLLHEEPVQLRATLHEYWHAIHYLMCGKVWSGEFPEAFLIDGGSYLGDIDVGYGPARIFDASEVREIAHALDNTQPAMLKQRFDPNRMLDYDIYPPIWDEDTQALDTCLEHFASLQHFMRHAAENDLGMVLYLGRSEHELKQAA